MAAAGAADELDHPFLSDDEHDVASDDDDSLIISASTTLKSSSRSIFDSKHSGNQFDSRLSPTLFDSKLSAAQFDSRHSADKLSAAQFDSRQSMVHFETPGAGEAQLEALAASPFSGPESVLVFLARGPVDDDTGSTELPDDCSLPGQPFGSDLCLAPACPERVAAEADVTPRSLPPVDEALVDEDDAAPPCPPAISGRHGAASRAQPPCSWLFARCSATACATPAPGRCLRVSL